MSLKKISLATTILVLVGLLFSSCDDDRFRYHWEQASIENVIQAGSDARGYFEGGYSIDLRSSLYDVNGRSLGAYVEDIQFRGGDIRLKVYGEHIEMMTLYLMYNGRERARLDMADARVGENLYNSSQVAAFLDEVAYVLAMDGRAYLDFQGQTRSRRGGDVNIDIYIDVDAYVRD